MFYYNSLGAIYLITMHTFCSDCNTAYIPILSSHSLRQRKRTYRNRHCYAPSRSAPLSSASPRDDSPTISYFSDNSRNIPLQNTSRDPHTFCVFFRFICKPIRHSHPIGNQCRTTILLKSTPRLIDYTIMLLSHPNSTINPLSGFIRLPHVL